MFFNIYASHEYPVNTADARNLIAMRRQSRQLLVPRKPQLHYAICATDRYGNESEPLQETTNKAVSNETAIAYKETLLACDGSKVEVNKAARLTDIEYLLIESLQGCVITVRPYQRNISIISIKNLPDGIYTLRSLNKKGVSHRLGTFIKKTK